MDEIKDITTFATCTEYEKSRWPVADAFYKEHYGSMATIFRPTWEEHRGMQQADIDVVIRWPEYCSYGYGELKISEKFRRASHDDILIEIYEDIDKPRESWGLKTAAQVHTYFHEHKYETGPRNARVQHDDSYVRLVPSLAIRKVAQMCRALFTEKFKDMRANNSNFEDVDFDGHTIYLILSPTRVNGKVAYRNACACVPKEVFEKFHFNIEEYKLCSTPEKE